MLNALLAEADTGKHVGTDATFKDVAERWLSISEQELSPTTVRRYQGLLRTHIYPAIGDRAAHKIRTTDLDDLYVALVRQRGLSPATVRQVHATIRRALSQAVRWGWIATNPAANTTPSGKSGEGHISSRQATALQHRPLLERWGPEAKLQSDRRTDRRDVLGQSDPMEAR